MYFENPQNKAVIQVSNGASWFWMLLLGPIYLAFKGIWTHVVVYILLWLALIVTVVGPFLVWLGYTFATYAIIRKHYIHNGWTEVNPTS